MICRSGFRRRNGLQAGHGDFNHLAYRVDEREAKIFKYVWTRQMYGTGENDDCSDRRVDRPKLAVVDTSGDDALDDTRGEGVVPINGAAGRTDLMYVVVGQRSECVAKTSNGILS